MADALNEALNLTRNQALGNALYIACGIIIFIGLVTSLVTTVRAHNYDGESQTAQVRDRPTRLKTWFRRRFLLPALFGDHHIRPMGYYQWPTRGQTLMVFGYLLLNVLFLATDYVGTGRTVKAVSDRAGHLAIVNMPIYFLFAGRNNILIWVTGWPQRDFQVFHKWIGRISTLEAIIHSAGYGYFAAQNHWDMSKGGKREAWFNGIAATSTVCAMLCFSMMAMRKRWYEFFLVVHIIGAILFLAFLYGHVKDFTHPYSIYVWVCVGIWALDRILRVVRLIIFNFRGRNVAKVKLIPGTTTIRLTVHPKMEDVGFAPGAHYFLYFPDRWCFWESHPFTAAAWRPAGPSLTQAPEKVLVLLEKISAKREAPPNNKRIRELAADEKITSLQLHNTHDTDTDTDREKKRPSKPRAPRKDAAFVVTTSSARRGPQRAKLTFLIHARHGVTLELLRRVTAAPNHSIELPCLLEGPYGIARPVQAFPTVILIAGGVGISTALPYLQQHLSTGVETSRRFVLIWSVRDGSLAEKLLAHIRGLGFRQDVVVKVFITRAKEGDSWRLPVGVKVRYRRPRIEDTIVREARERVPGTPMCVVACGGAAVVDCARKGSVLALEDAGGMKGTGEIAYWEEGYGW